MKIKIVSLLLSLILIITLIPIQNIKAYENDIEELQALITEGESITDFKSTTFYIWLNNVKNFSNKYTKSFIYDDLYNMYQNLNQYGADGIEDRNYVICLTDLYWLLSELTNTNNYTINDLINYSNTIIDYKSISTYKYIRDIKYTLKQNYEFINSKDVYDNAINMCDNLYWNNINGNSDDRLIKLISYLLILNEEIPINSEIQDIDINILTNNLYIIEDSVLNRSNLKVTAIFKDYYNDGSTNIRNKIITNYNELLNTKNNTITISYVYKNILKEKTINIIIIPNIITSTSLVIYANNNLLKDSGINPTDLSNKKLSFCDFECNMSRVQRDVDADGIDDYYGFGYNKNLETLIYSQFNTDSIKWQFEDIKMKYDISERIQDSAVQAWFDNKLGFLIDSAELESFIKTTGISYTKITVNGLSTIEENKIEELENTNIKVPSNIKIKKNNSKKITISYSKISNAKYEIQISTDKNLKKNVKTYNTKKNKVSIKNLKKTKTYYIRIRAIKTIDGKDYYSEWSNIKSIKMKK